MFWSCRSEAAASFNAHGGERTVPTPDNTTSISIGAEVDPGCSHKSENTPSLGALRRTRPAALLPS